MSDNNFTIRPIELFKVLSDPTRLKIFQILFNKQSRCVGELVEILDQPQPTISHHSGKSSATSYHIHVPSRTQFKIPNFFK